MPLSTVGVNAPTVIIAVIIAVIFCAIVINGIRRRKKGEGGCGCGCSNCPSNGICHGNKTKGEQK